MARVLVAVVLLGTAAIADATESTPTKMSVAGDSLSQAALADGVIPSDQPWNSWAYGWAIRSVWARYRDSYWWMYAEPVSRDGARMIPDFTAQALAMCGQWPKPNRVFVLLGQNDACNSAPSSTSDAAANMPTTQAFVDGLEAGLSLLGGCLPARSIVQVVSVVRVDFLYEAGLAKSRTYCPFVWEALDICRIVTAEEKRMRREQIGQRIDDWNEAIRQTVQAYDYDPVRNPNEVLFVTDWIGSIAQGYRDTSAGTYQFGPDDIDGLDCFHASVAGQKKLACAEWTASPDGGGSTVACLQ